MKSIGTCPVCKKPIDPARGIYRIEEKDYHPKCDEKWQAESAKPAPNQDWEPAGEALAALLTAIAEGQENLPMTLHAAIGVLVAVSLPIWLVVERIFKWRALNAAGSPQHAEGRHA